MWLEGRPQPALLDTGALTTLAQPWAEQMGAAGCGAVTIEDAGGRTRAVPYARVPQLHLGSVEVRDVGVIVGWDAPPSRLACFSGLGLVGANALSAGRWHLDIEGGRLAVDGRVSFAEEGGVSLPMTVLANGSPQMRLTLDGRPLDVMVDTGAAVDVELPAALHRRLAARATPTARGHGDGASGFLGPVMGEVAIFRHRIGVGAIQLERWPVTVREGGDRARVGVGFLRHFDIVLDWPGRRVELRPKAPIAAPPPLEGLGLGLRLASNGRLTVGFLWRHSPAEDAGLQVGDTITAIAGSGEEPMPFDDYCRLSTRLGELEKMRIAVESPTGKREVTLRRGAFERMSVSVR
ncbi:MAG: hypothetical protein R3B72_44855 [Polyangiaceae bacterium]